MLLLFIIILLTFIVMYIGVTAYVHDLKLKNLKLGEFKNKNILFIFPHPDDETMFCGGLIRATKNIASTRSVISITAGEKGIERLRVPQVELAKIRKQEFSLSMNNLEVDNFYVWNFADGGTTNKVDEIKEKVRKFIEINNINYVVTYEKFGVYGHPDHVTLSKVIYELSSELDFETLYATLPNKILSKIKLPRKLVYKDKVVELTPETITNPQYKFNTIKFIIRKYKAAKCYKSQNVSQGMPLSIMMALNSFEYYTKEYKKNKI